MTLDKREFYCGPSIPGPFAAGLRGRGLTGGPVIVVVVVNFGKNH
jgi:hypothetical protein